MVVKMTTMQQGVLICRCRVQRSCKSGFSRVHGEKQDVMDGCPAGARAHVRVRSCARSHPSVLGMHVSLRACARPVTVEQSCALGRSVQVESSLGGRLLVE